MASSPGGLGQLGDLLPVSASAKRRCDHVLDKRPTRISELGSIRARISRYGGVQITNRLRPDEDCWRRGGRWRRGNEWRVVGQVQRDFDRPRRRIVWIVSDLPGQRRHARRDAHLWLQRARHPSEAERSAVAHSKKRVPIPNHDRNIDGEALGSKSGRLSRALLLVGDRGEGLHFWRLRGPIGLVKLCLCV